MAYVFHRAETPKIEIPEFTLPVDLSDGIDGYRTRTVRDHVGVRRWRQDIKQASPRQAPSLTRRSAWVEVVHDASQDKRICPCGTAIVEIGEDVIEQLGIVPMQVRVLRHIRKRYGCPGSTHALAPQRLGG